MHKSGHAILCAHTPVRHRDICDGPKYIGTTLHGGKAYLVGGASSPARITIAGIGDTTGIESIGAEAIGTDGSQVPCYDLQGRRVSPTRKGIYVINGKKVVK